MTYRRTRLVTLFVILVVVVSLLPNAPAPFAVPVAQAAVPLFKPPLYLNLNNLISTSSVALGDLNGDGSLDILLGNYNQPSQVYLNDGQGRFTPTAAPLNPTGNATNGVALGDLNGDGALDILLGNSNQPSQVYLNDGQGRFTPTAVPLNPTGNDTQSVALGDLNGDGSLDLVLGNSNQPSQVYLNDGQGRFAPTAAPLNPTGNDTRSVALGDFNNDETLDIVLGNVFFGFHGQGQSSQVYLNDGQSGFTLAPTISLPSSSGIVALGDLNSDDALDTLLVGNSTQPSQFWLNDMLWGGYSAAWFNPFGNETQSVALGDLNGDGALDIVLGNSNQPSRVYLSDRPNTFMPTTAPLNPVSSAIQRVALGDLNGDGALDIVISSMPDLGPLQSSQIYLNDGQGGFAPTAAPLNPTGNSTMSVAMGDLNGDGTLDIVLGNAGEPSQVYLNDGQGSFAPTATPLNPTGNGTRNVALGDLNGDGSLDIVLGNSSGPSQVYLNDGQGGFTPTAAPLDLTGSWNGSVALGDLNDDSALDIVLDNQVYLNDGQGGFTAAPLYSTPDPYPAPTGQPHHIFNWTQSVALGDLNGDGSLDIVLGNIGEPSQVYLNNGQGGFTPTAAPLNPNGNLTESVALGDLNGDGALDIILGNYEQPSQVYLNNGQGGFTPTADPLNPTTSVALGDINGDGALDILSFGNWKQPIWVSLNDGRGGFATAVSLIPIDHDTRSVALGDLNGDGALDIVLGNDYLPIQVYLNDGQGTFTPTAAAPHNPAGNETRSVALGDLNGDGSLDIVLGNFLGPSQVYLNDGRGSFTPTTAPLNPVGNATTSVALGDLNRDGTLDILLGNYEQPSLVYLNDGRGGFASTTAPLNPNGNNTESVALGDLNGDGTLDILLGNAGEPSQVYLNDGQSSFTPTAAPLNPNGNDTRSNDTRSVALGDLNGDGNLDILLGNSNQPSQVYLNDGQGGFAPTADPLNPYGNNTTSVALGDLNSDGVLDILLGIPFASQIPSASQVYLNDGQGHFTPTANSLDLFYSNGATTTSVALGDLNGDGTLDILLGNYLRSSYVYLNNSTTHARLPNNPPTVAVTRPGHTPDANFYSTPEIISSPVISIPYTLTDYEGDPVRAISATFSLDGGGTWQPAVPASPPARDTTPTGTAHTFAWDTFASGFFGQADNVVVRLVAYPALTTGRNSTPLFQRPYAAATTFPFRVRGTQVRVVDAQNTPQPDAVVFRLNDTLPPAQQLFASSSTAPAFTTNGSGFLGGRGELAFGDTLIALAPITLTGTFTDAYSPTVRLYATNIVATPTGVSGLTVTQSGVQTVTVSLAHPLALFDLSVSLEWDARYDARFMLQLQTDLARASELLFQASHGQAAFGSVAIFHDKENWDAADIRIYASNRVRPSAMIGGIATQVITDPTTLSTVVYGPGQVHMGAIWNRFGNGSGNLSEDWPRTLVHELGHYLFFLEDNYLGLNQDNVVPVSSCPGLMADAYAAVWQYQTSASWRPGCDRTFSSQTTGRADWATIQTFYPTFVPPTLPLSTLPSGPIRLPLATTEITSVEPLTPTTRLDVPIFYTVDEVGGRVLPALTARAYLFQHDHAAPDGTYTQIIPLGRATNDQVLARGARVGDKLCLFEPTAARFGCETISVGREQLTLQQRPAWQPAIQITPVTSVTLAVTVTGVPSDGLGLRAELYPLDDDPLPPPITLSAAGNGVYGGNFTLDYPLQGAYVHLQTTDGPTPTWETVTNYALDGNAGTYSRVNSGGANSRVNSGGANSRVNSGGANSRVKNGGANSRVKNGGGFARIGGAPVSSAEGDVQLVGANLSFALGQFLLLQTTSILPPLPAWATLIGQGYRFTTSPNAPDLTGSALSFSYLEAEVPTGEEPGIQVYYRSPTATTWTPITTTLDTYFNLASIPTQGPGLYALMSSVHVALPAAGWNLFAYPVAGSREVGLALGSISGQYGIVYSHVPTDTLDPWKVYAPAPAPSWVSDLTELRFGQGYWLYATQATELLLNGGSTAQLADALSVPPATVYGVLSPMNGVAPTVGAAVEARIGATVCGRSVTQQVGEQVGFVVKVAAAEPVDFACGASGRAVTVTVNGNSVGHAWWDNTRAVNLAATALVYVPLLWR